MNRTPAIPAMRELPAGLYSPCAETPGLFQEPGLVLGPFRREDLEVIRDILIERETKRAAEAGTPPNFGAALSLDNARAVLAVGLRNRPDAWTITAEELPALWAELCPELVEGMETEGPGENYYQRGRKGD